jgi:hypothetical protein
MNPGCVVSDAHAVSGRLILLRQSAGLLVRTDLSRESGQADFTDRMGWDGWTLTAYRQSSCQKIARSAP